MNREFYKDHEFQRNHYGIYCIECIETNVKYIGQTTESFYRRWIYHKWGLKNDHHSNTYLQNAWNKYGDKNFKFYPIKIFELEQKWNVGKKELDQLEEYYIKKFDTFDNGFNLTTGGDKCNMNPMSERTKRLIGEKNRINMFGKKHTEETKRLMSQVHIGYIKTDEHRINLSKALTGIKRSDEQKEKCRVANQGSKQKTAKYNEETISKLKIDLINGMSVSDSSNKYDINYKYIYSGILSDLRWKHVRPNGWDEFLKNKHKKAI